MRHQKLWSETSLFLATRTPISWTISPLLVAAQMLPLEPCGQNLNGKTRSTIQGECGFLAANLYAKSVFGEDALVNLSIEKQNRWSIV
ncbi:unnamed protein product [Cochlearia groenlandica]